VPKFAAVVTLDVGNILFGLCGLSEVHSIICEGRANTDDSQWLFVGISFPVHQQVICCCDGLGELVSAIQVVVLDVADQSAISDLIRTEDEHYGKVSVSRF
jgi:hypothetical protein